MKSIKINLNAAAFINEVEKFSKHPLNRKVEMISLYEAAVNSNQLEVYRELCFTSKYLVGIIRILKEGMLINQHSNLESIKKDFSDNVVKAEAQIKQLLIDSEDSIKQYFEDQFFEKSQSALSKFNELLIDLEKSKLYLNYLKREKRNQE